MKAGTASSLLLSALAAALVAAPSSAAPGPVAPVAAGFADWANVTDKNLLAGLSLTPSDLRQRTVVYVAVDDAWLTNERVADLKGLFSLASRPGDDVVWATADISAAYAKRMVVVSVRNAKGLDAAAFAKRLKAPKGGDKAVARAYELVSHGVIPFYADLAPVGEKGMTADRLPYVAVYGAASPDPLFKAAKFDPKAVVEEVRKAVKAADAQLPADWTLPFGVRDMKHCQAVKALYAKGKPASAMLSALKPGIASADAEVARESQTVYDAINQYCTALKTRIVRECRTSPMRAVCDLQELVRVFPAERKRLSAVEAKLKASKEVGSVSRMLEKLMLWSRRDFAPKSEGEAKKIVAELQKMKKAFAVLAASKDVRVQGEAMVFASQLDTLIDSIPTKVPQK